MSATVDEKVSHAELAAYVDGELSGTEAERIEAALLEDQDLRAEMSRMLAERDALREALATSDTPDPAISALAERLDGRMRAARVRRRATMAAAGVAIASLLGAVGWVGHAALTGTPMFSEADPARGSDYASVPGFVADAAGAHAVFAEDEIHPVEFFAVDEPVMQRWFRAHLGQEAMIPHLEELGFELVGGRLLGDAEGAMAQILYKNAAGDKVTLAFGKRDVPGGEELKLVHVGKQYASYWRDRGYAWAVVEDSPGADVSAVATHVAALIRATK